jgi:hypothetical protein
MKIARNVRVRRAGSGAGLTTLAMTIAVALLVAFSGTAEAATAAGLGTADSFAVLGGSTVTNTGPSVISGDLGVSPGSEVTGFPPGTVTNGTIHAADAVAAQAQDDTSTAYDNLAGQRCDEDLTDQDLGGKTLTSGVYCFDSSAQLTGTLTLDAQGNPNAVFIFQIGSTLTTASNSGVNLINGAQACRVFWQVGSSATLGTTTAFIGNVLALTSITANTSATVDGRLLAQNGAVTLDSNTITRATCGSGGTTGGTTTGATTGLTTGGETTGVTTGGETTGVTTGGETTGVTTGGETTGQTSGGETTGVTTGGETTGQTTGGETTGVTTGGETTGQTSGGVTTGVTTGGETTGQTSGGVTTGVTTGGVTTGLTTGVTTGGVTTGVTTGGATTTGTTGHTTGGDTTGEDDHHHGDHGDHHGDHDSDEDHGDHWDHHGGGHHGQVKQVPTGSVNTGDGSTVTTTGNASASAS